MWVIRAEISRAVLSSLALCISLGDRAEIYYIHVMRNSFVTEPARFVCSPVLDHPSVVRTTPKRFWIGRGLKP